MPCATFCYAGPVAISPSPFRAFLSATRKFARARSLPMIGLVRAAAFCATLALGLSSAFAADKSYKRDDLADAAIKLEAQIKKEAGAVTKSPATLRSDADAAFKRY